MSGSGRVAAFIVFALVAATAVYWGIAAGVSNRRLSAVRAALPDAPASIRKTLERDTGLPAPDTSPVDVPAPWDQLAPGNQDWTALSEGLRTRGASWDWQQHAPFMQSQQDLVALIRAAAANGAFRQNPPVKVEDTAGLQDGLSKIRHAARILQADALYHAAQGDYATYARDLEAMLQLAAHLDDPLLISQMVRTAVTGLAFETACMGPSGGALPETARESVLNTAADASMRLQGALAEAYAYESRWTAQIYDDIRAGQPASGFGNWLVSSPVARPWVNLDEAAWEGIAIATTEALTMPFHEGRARLESIQQDGQELPALRIISRVTSANGVPALIRAQEGAARQEAMLDLMRLGLEIEAYKDEHGVCPGSLDLVAPNTTDPFSGEPYVYRPEGETFTLYSVGTRDRRVVWRGGTP